jgi:hypothetical protein
MLKTMGLSDTLSAFGDGRQHAEPAQLSLQMDGDRRSDISSRLENTASRSRRQPT